MRSVAFLWLGLALLWLGAGAIAATPGPVLKPAPHTGTGGVSLSDFVRQIASDHPRTAAAAESTASSEALTEAAKGARLPQISGSAASGRSQSPLTGVINSGFRPGVSASQLLYDGGRTDNNIKGREQDALAAAAQREEVVLSLTSRMAEAYLEWHRQNRLLALADQQLIALDRFDRLVKEISSFDRGRTSDERLVNSRIVQTRNLRDARAVNVRDNIKQMQQICVCALTPAIAPPEFARLLPEYLPADGGAALLREHPSVIGAQARRDSNIADADAAAAWWVPTLELQLSSFSEITAAGGHRYFSQNAAYLNLKGNVFDGRTGAFREDAIRARARSLDATLNATMTELEAEANRYWSAVEERKGRITSLQNVIVETDAAFDVVFEQFKLGRRSVIELLTYENERYAVRGQLIAEEMDMEVSRMRWLSAVGKLPEKLGARD